MPDVIKSISYNQGEIIRNILKLHVPEGKIDCDATFSTGAFYNGTDIALPQYRFDISPLRSDVVQADARHLPLADGSISCMMLDPPFLATKGKSLNGTDGNIINRRFGVYPDEKSLHQCYSDMLIEAYRVLKPDGILIFKCQDKVSSGQAVYEPCVHYKRSSSYRFLPERPVYPACKKPSGSQLAKAESEAQPQIPFLFYRASKI